MTLPTVTGEFRVAGDPNLRFAPSGVAVCNLRAVASSRKKVDEEWVDDKSAWVNLTGFKKQAENMAESLQKGDLVTVIGKMNTEDWEDGEGNKRTSVNILVDSIGPAVTWTPATVHRTERSSGGSSAGQRSGGGGASRSSGPPAEDPWAAPPAGQEDPPF